MPYWRARLEEIVENFFYKLTGRQRPEPDSPDWCVSMRDHWTMEDGKIVGTDGNYFNQDVNLHENVSMGDPKYVPWRILVEANGGSEHCHGCGAPVNGGRGRCVYCGRMYSRAYK
jgi:hypothetical protein